MSDKRKVGLALGGGGARGIAHVGVLEHLERLQIPIDIISGTSAGAIVGTLYAFGVPLEQIGEDVKNLKPADFSSLRVPKLGFFKNDGLKKLLEKRLSRGAKIEDAQKELAILASDIETGESHLMTKGPVIPAVLASSCVPGIYIPQKIDGRLLVDGGLSENVPLSGLEHYKASVKIGVDLNGYEKYPKPEGILDILSNSLDIAIDNQTRSQLQKADYVISMDLSRYSRFTTEHFDELISEGKKAAESLNKEFKNLEKSFIKELGQQIHSKFKNIT